MGAASAPDQAQAPPPPPRRPACPACGRPARVCLCASLPPTPHALAGRLLLLQHPHEAGRRKATAPLLPRCVAPVTVLVGRTFEPGDGAGAGGRANPKACPPALVAALADAAAGRVPLFVLWPASPDAVDLEDLVAARTTGSTSAAGTDAPSPSSLPAYTLLALDGTWRQAREMWGAATAGAAEGGGWLGGAPGVTVVRVGARHSAEAGALFVEPDGDGAGGGGEEGGCAGGGVCVSTAEAVAAGLATLEPPGAPGPPAISRAVAAMAAMAARFDPAVAARLGLVARWGRRGGGGEGAAALSWERGF